MHHHAANHATHMSTRQVCTMRDIWSLVMLYRNLLDRQLHSPNIASTALRPNLESAFATRRRRKPHLLPPGMQSKCIFLCSLLKSGIVAGTSSIADRRRGKQTAARYESQAPKQETMKHETPAAAHIAGSMVGDRPFGQPLCADSVLENKQCHHI